MLLVGQVWHVHECLCKLGFPTLIYMYMRVWYMITCKHKHTDALRMCVCARTHTHTHTYTQHVCIHTLVHTYIHTYIHAQRSSMHGYIQWKQTSIMCWRMITARATQWCAPYKPNTKAYTYIALHTLIHIHIHVLHVYVTCVHHANMACIYSYDAHTILQIWHTYTHKWCIYRNTNMAYIYT